MPDPSPNQPLTAIADPMPTPPMHPVQIGPYRITGILGRGGMGVVYRGVVVVSCEVPMGQEVAIKLLRDADASERVRFAREAVYLQKLRHPNIVRVYDAGEYGGQPYIVMQLLQGRHVDALVANGRQLEQRRAAEITVQGLDALVAAHRQGILHRDLKPGNLIIGDDGVVRLLDFGLAQLMIMESGLTASGAVVGTPAYMSPEQARGDREKVSPRSDIYGMGACLYELVTGHPPFEADNPVAVLHRVVNGHPTPARKWRPDIDRDLETILLKAMAKSPQDRYPNATAMADDLRRFLRGERITTRRPSPVTRLVRQAWEERRTVASMGLGIFVSMALVVLLIDIAITRRPAQAPAATVPAAQPPNAAIPPETAATSQAASTTVAATTLLPPPETPWITAWEHVMPVRGGTSELKTHKYPDKKVDLDYIILPAVSGPVKLSCYANLGEGNTRVELLINDRDVGAGYRASLEAANGKDGRLSLVRDRRTLISRTIPGIPRSTPLRLTIERQDDHRIVVTCEGVQPLELDDLVPIEDLDGNGVFVVFAPQANVYDVRLERKRRPEMTSPLAPADSKRLMGRWANAKNGYEEYIRDYPHSPLVREARLRIAMCDRKLDNIEAALETCNELVSTWRNDIRFMQQATFQAWLCALDLKRFQEAGEYLTALERDFDLNYLLTMSDGGRVRDLLVDHIKRGEELAQQGLRAQAAETFGRAEGVALFLHRKDDLRRIRHWRGDLLRSLDDRAGEALAVFRRIADEQGETKAERGWGLLKSAETLRLMGDTREAAIVFRRIIAQAAELPTELPQIARLWLGEVFIETGNVAEAYDVWRSSTETSSIPGRIMNALLSGRMIPPPATRSAFDNDIPYFSARLAAMNGDLAGARAYLDASLERCPAWDWPSPLARQWIARLDQGMAAGGPTR